MNGASPTPQAASRMIHNMHVHVRVGARLGAVWACMYTAHACSGAGTRTRAVPYRTAAGHLSLRIMDRSLNACKTFHSKNQCSIYGSVIECM